MNPVMEMNSMQETTEHQPQNSSSVPRQNQVIHRTIPNQGPHLGGSVLTESGITGTGLTQYTTTGHKSLPLTQGYPTSPPPAYTSQSSDRYANVVIPSDCPRPDKLTEAQFDIAVAFVEQDEKPAKAFIEILEKFVRFGDNKPPKVCVVSKHEGFAWVQNQIRSIGEAVKRSTYVYMVITEDYLKDVWADTVTCETVQHTIDDAKRQWCIVPVFLEDRKHLKLEIPFGMKSLRGVEVSRMFTSQINRSIKSLEEINVDSLTKASFDKYFLEGQSKTLNCKAHLREIREKKQKESLIDWERKTKIQLVRDAEMKQRQEELKRKQEQKEEKEHGEHLEKMQLNKNKNIDPMRMVPTTTSGHQTVYHIHNPQNCNFGADGKVIVNNESEGQVTQYFDQTSREEVEIEIDEEEVPPGAVPVVREGSVQDLNDLAHLRTSVQVSNDDETPSPQPPGQTPSSDSVFEHPFRGELSLSSEPSLRMAPDVSFDAVLHPSESTRSVLPTLSSTYVSREGEELMADQGAMAGAGGGHGEAMAASHIGGADTQPKSTPDPSPFLS